MIVLAPLVVTLVLSTLTVSPPAMDPAAKQRFDRGLAGYTAKRYADAIKDFRLAYALDPRPEILFSWAQAERLYGRCSQASKLYQRFLKTKPSAQQAEAARTGIERCKDQPDTAPADPEDVEVPAPTPTPEPPPEPGPEKPPPSRPRVDVLGVSLIGAGAVLGVVGAGLLGAGERKATRLGDATTYGEYADGSGQVRALRISGGVLAGVGGALIVGGIVKLLVHRRQSRRDVAFWTAPHGAGMLLRLRF